MVKLVSPSGDPIALLRQFGHFFTMFSPLVKQFKVVMRPKDARKMQCGVRCRGSGKGYPRGGHLTEAAEPQAWQSQGYPRQDPRYLF
jgi:hypothetical protein